MHLSVRVFAQSGLVTFIEGAVQAVHASFECSVCKRYVIFQRQQAKICVQDLWRDTRFALPGKGMSCTVQARSQTTGFVIDFLDRFKQLEL